MGKSTGEMLEGSNIEALESAGYVPFFAAGASARGEFFCSECGYGVSIQQRLPLCPMCGGSSWEQRRPPFGN